MSTIQSTLVSRQFSHLEDAASRATELATPVADVLKELLSPHLREGELLPDIAFLQVLIGRFLQSTNEQLIGIDHERKHRQNVDRQRLQVRNETANKLRNALAEVRFFLDRTLERKVANSVFEGRSDLSKLKSPVLERVSERILALINDPKMAWDALPDSGHRILLQVNRDRLSTVLNEYLAVAGEIRTERSSLLLSKGAFDRDMNEKGLWLRRGIKWLAGFFRGAGFDREAEALVLRRRATPKKEDQKEKSPTEGTTPPIPAPAGGSSNPSTMNP